MLGVTGPVMADDAADCDQSDDLDLRIRGCAGLIASGALKSEDAALAYSTRGSAYRSISDYGHAIADYHEAIISYDEVIQLSNKGDVKQALYHFEGEPVAGRILWHTDLIYTTTPNRGALLRMVEKPEVGGRQVGSTRRPPTTRCRRR